MYRENQPYQPAQSKALRQAERVFNRWRNRSSRSERGRVPKHLWDLACALVIRKRLPMRQIASRLKLNPTSFRAQLKQRPVAGSERRKGRPKTSTQKASHSASWIPIRAADMLPPHSEPLEVEVTTASGKRLRVRAEAAALRALLFESSLFQEAPASSPQLEQREEGTCSP